MKSIRGVHFMINMAAATALAAPSPVPDVEPEKLKRKSKKKAAPHTPKEIKAAEAAARYTGKPVRHPNVSSLKAVQHAGKHKNKGTTKGYPFKPR